MHRISIYYRNDNKNAVLWSKKIKDYLRRFPRVRLADKNPQVVVILGGDGTILEAAQKYQKGRDPLENLEHAF